MNPNKTKETLDDYRQKSNRFGVEFWQILDQELDTLGHFNYCWKSTLQNQI